MEDRDRLISVAELREMFADSPSILRLLEDRLGYRIGSPGVEEECLVAVGKPFTPVKIGDHDREFIESCERAEREQMQNNPGACIGTPSKSDLERIIREELKNDSDEKSDELDLFRGVEAWLEKDQAPLADRWYASIVAPCRDEEIRRQEGQREAAARMANHRCY